MLHSVIAESNFQDQLLVETSHIFPHIKSLQTNELFCLSRYGHCPLDKHTCLTQPM